MTDQKNTLLAIVLSAIVLIVWQYFFGLPHMQRQEAQKQPQTQTQGVPTPAPGGGPSTTVPVPGQPATVPAAQVLTRDAALKQTARVPIDTPRLKGSIGLKGGLSDVILLAQYHETVDPNSPIVVLLSPSESPHPFYAEFGWVAAAGAGAKPPALPGADTVWRQEGSGALTPDRPIVLIYSNNEGLTFRRTISVDDKYLFTVKDEVANSGTQAVTLFPYSLVSRHGTPETLGYYILHEGLIGVLGDKGLQEITYKAIEDKKKLTFPKVTNAWLGITDKYWAAALVPDPNATLDAEFSAGEVGSVKTYQTAYVFGEQRIAPGATGTATGRLFAGAKEVHVVNGYNSQLGLNLFDRLIDWGWFWFITKPMFEFMDWIYRLVGNFGVAILIVSCRLK